MKKKLGVFSLVAATIFAIIVTVFINRMVHAVPQEHVFYGDYETQGRAAYGHLIIKRKTISWDTSFSKFQNIPYKILSLKIGKDYQECVFVLKKSVKGNFYNVLILDHKGLLSSDIGWEVTAYCSLADYKTDNIDNCLGSYAIRLERY